jgi:hypothetical protein
MFRFLKTLSLSLSLSLSRDLQTINENVGHGAAAACKVIGRKNGSYFWKWDDAPNLFVTAYLFTWTPGFLVPKFCPKNPLRYSIVS